MLILNRVSVVLDLCGNFQSKMTRMWLTGSRRLLHQSRRQGRWCMPSKRGYTNAVEENLVVIPSGFPLVLWRRIRFHGSQFAASAKDEEDNHWPSTIDLKTGIMIYGFFLYPRLSWVGFNLNSAEGLCTESLLYFPIWIVLGVEIRCMPEESALA